MTATIMTTVAVVDPTMAVPFTVKRAQDGYRASAHLISIISDREDMQG